MRMAMGFGQFLWVWVWSWTPGPGPGLGEAAIMMASVKWIWGLIIPQRQRLLTVQWKALPHSAAYLNVVSSPCPRPDLDFRFLGRRMKLGT